MLSTALKQAAERANKEVARARKDLLTAILNTYGATSGASVKCDNGCVTIVTDQPNKFTQEVVDTIAEAWREAFGENVEVKIIDVDYRLD